MSLPQFICLIDDLYSDGWRKEDKEKLMIAYESVIDEESAEMICKYLGRAERIKNKVKQ